MGFFDFMQSGQPQGQQVGQTPYQGYMQPTVSGANPPTIPASVQPGATPQENSAIADALMSGAADPNAEGKKNENSLQTRLGGISNISYILASIGSALSARDPNSWQHQLGNMVKSGSQTQQLARQQLVAALSQKMKQTPVIGQEFSKASTLGSGLGDMGSMKPEFSLDKFKMSPSYTDLLGGTNNANRA
jgi:hypothetical protein